MALCLSVERATIWRAGSLCRFQASSTWSIAPLRASLSGLRSLRQVMGQRSASPVTRRSSSERGNQVPAFSMGKTCLPPWKWSWVRMEPPTMGRSALEPMK